MNASRWPIIIALGFALATAGCAANSELDLTTGAIANPVPPSDQRPSDDDLAMGRKHYLAANYGNAERHFREAVEANPKNAPAWLGLAASYDRLGRYKLASRAYKQVLGLKGRTGTVLNNLGYHHLLRGNIKKARRLFREALRKDPENPHIQGNLYLADTWKTGTRPPGLQDHIVDGKRRG